jgi:hypothetical protein
VGSEGSSTTQSERAEAKDPERGADEFISPDELGPVIDDLRAGRRPAILEDPEP